MGAAVLGALCLHLYLRRYEHEVRGGAPVPVVSVVRDVSPGHVLGEDDLDEREIPERYLDERHVPARDLERVLGNRLQVAIAAGDALLWTDIGVSEGVTQLSELVEVGHRAVRVAGSDVSFGGLLRPGDRVDVLLTVTPDGPLQDGETHTRTLIENVIALAVGDSVMRDEQGTVRSSAAVTLKVSPNQAELLESSRRRGRLAISLRNPDDITVAAAPHGAKADDR